MRARRSREETVSSAARAEDDAGGKSSRDAAGDQPAACAHWGEALRFRGRTGQRRGGGHDDGVISQATTRPPVGILVFGVAAQERWIAAAGASSQPVLMGTQLDELRGCVTLILDLSTEADPLDALRTVSLSPGVTVIAVVQEGSQALVADVLQAGTHAVVSSAVEALWYAMACGLAVRLHDGLVQSLTSARLQLSMAARVSDGAADAAALSAVGEALDEAATELSAVLGGLRAVLS